MAQRYVITGGAGFIGTNVVLMLAASGEEVVVVDDMRAGVRARVSPHSTVHEIDITDTERLRSVLLPGDRIIHLAALPRVQFSIEHPEASMAVNVNGTLSVLEAARASGAARVVLASSSAIYGDQDVVPLHESLPAHPKSPYGLHKYMSEGLLRMWSELYDLPTVSLRFFNVYGPHFDPDGPYALVIGRFLKQALSGSPLTIVGDGTNVRDYVHVEDVCRALLLAATHEGVGRGEVCNIGTGVGTSVLELARLIGGTVEHLPPRIEPRASVADITAARELLGWSPQVKLEEGIGMLRASLKETSGQER